MIDALPAIRQARLVRATVVREPRATFSLAPGQPARPPVQTAVRGLYLAGDWIDTGLPATIESAVRALVDEVEFSSSGAGTAVRMVMHHDADYDTNGDGR